jgi:hypothetical protein
MKKAIRQRHQIFYFCGLVQHFAGIMSAVPQSVKSNLIAAFRHLLKPLVRLAIKNGVSIREFSQAIKGTYVDVATKQISSAGDKATREAISVMLNVDTTDIADILSTPTSANFQYEDDQSSPVSRVLAGWFTDPRSSGPYGVLVDLPFEARGDSTRGSPVTFSDLALKYCPGTPAKELLDESIRTGCVITVGSGFFRAVKRSYVPDPLSAVSISHFAHVVHNLCESFEINLRAESGGGKGLFERTVISDTRLTREDLQAFDKYVRNRGQLFADDIDNWLTSRSAPGPKDVNPVNTGIGIYHFVINDEDDREFAQIPTIEGMKKDER